MTDRVAVTLVSGFLGAGKTTYIVDRLLPRVPAATVVVLNELGGGIGERSLFGRFETELLGGGCCCCEQRDELRALLRGLVGRARRQPLTQIIIELTGIAHPERVTQLLDQDPLLQHRTSLREVVVVADALALRQTLALHAEAAAQLAAADRIVLSKTDLCGASVVSDAVALVGHINPDAVLEGVGADLIPRLAAAPPSTRDLGIHLADVETATLEFSRPLTWQVFGAWLTLLVHAHGQRLLRFKASIDTGGDGPVLLDAVQEVVHQPRHLPSWPQARRTSTMTFIARGLDVARVRHSLERSSAPSGRWPAMASSAEISRRPERRRPSGIGPRRRTTPAACRRAPARRSPRAPRWPRPAPPRRAPPRPGTPAA
jgi:G3E family GTPase